MTVQGITGYKNVLPNDESGAIDYSTENIQHYDAGTGTSERINTDISGEDENFDIPDEGVGYYVIKGHNGSFSAADSSYVYKLTQYEEGDNRVKRAYSTSNITLSANDVLRFKYYGFSDGHTTYETLPITTSGNSKTEINESGDVKVVSGSSVSYKVWLDYDTTSGRTAWLETVGSFVEEVEEEQVSTIRSNTPKMPGHGPKRATFSGGTRVFVEYSAVSSWWTNPFIYVWNGSTTAKKAMTTGDNNYLWVDLPDGNWTNCIFYRAEKIDSTWWNQTTDQSFATSKNVFTFDGNGGDKSKTGSWSTGSFLSGTYYVKDPTNNWAADGARLSANLCNGPSANSWINLTRVGTSQYYIATLPEGYWNNIIFCRMDPNGSNQWSSRWNQTENQSKPSDSKKCFTLPSAPEGQTTSGGSWGSHTFTLTVSAGSNGTVSGGGDITIGGSSTISATANSGYHFAKWDDNNTNASRSLSNLAPDSKISYTASFAANTLTVKYNANGGSGSAMSDSSLTYGASGWDTLRTNTYTKGGYTFAGWATSEDGSVAYADGGPLTVSDFSAASGTLNLYAKWTANKYSVSFYGNYPNDATSTSSLIETKTNQTYNTNYTLPSSNPSYTGWTFAGWYDAATGGSEITGSTLITTAGNHNIYAHWTANTYTVRFHSNHDSDVTVDQDFTYDAAAAALTSTATLFNTANFEKSGWVFDEWTANADGTGTSYTDGQSVRNLTATVNGVYHIYAQWKQTYNVIYNANEATGGSVPTSHSNIDFGTGITVKGNTGSLYKNGYVFNGWNTADDGNGTHYAVDATPAAFNANTTLFAEWVADIYTIVLDNDSATSAGTTSIYEKYGVGYYLDSAASSQQMTASSNPITKPTKNGYVFGGYWTVDGGSGTKYIDENGKLTSSAVTTTFHQNSGTLKLYAKWTLGVYEIQLDNDSATSAGATSIYEKYNTGYYLNYSAEAVSNQMSPSSNPIDVPRKTGYTFGGYYTEENGNGTQYIDTNGNLTSSAVTTTFYDGITLKLYAKWTANKYTVTLNNEDADALTPGADSVTATYNDALPSIAANKPVRSGYTFGGYWTVAGGGGSMYIKADGTSNIDHYLIDGTTTLYAKWSRTVSLDGYSVDNTSTQNFTLIWHAVASGNITAPSKTGYTFGGYFTGTSGSGTKIFNANGTPANAWNVAGDTLHALWTANTYSVTLNGNDGTPASQSITATYDAAMPGTNTSSAALTIPTRTGYTFGGYWTSSNSGTTLVTQYYNDDLTSTKSWVETDVTVLYAKWTIKTTRITFNGNGNDSGSVPNSIDVNYGSVPSSLGATALVKAGYHFGGYWYSSNGGSTLSKRYFAPAGSFSQVNWDREEASITLYAQWIANDYKVRFYSNGGTGGPTTQTFTYDAAAQALTSFDSLSFANTGMHFVKWNTQSNGEGTDYSDGQSVRNLTTALNGYFDLYAVWAYNEYSVAFDKNDGGGSNGSQSGFVYNTSKALTAFESLSITAPTGMHFVGWATSSEGSKAYDDGDSLVTPTPTPSHNGTFTLYALWEYNTYTVTLDPSKNGVTVLTNGDTSTTATFNSAMRSITVPTADGYVFRGYYTGADGAGTKYYNQDGSSANTWNLTSDTTLHAKWELKTKFEQGDVIYYVPSDAWLASPEGKTTYTAAYFYTSSAPYYRWWVKFSDFTTVETSPRTLFSVTVPGNSTISTWDGMQFCRYDSTKDGNININAGPDDNTSNLWNYTSPFTYTAGKDLLYGVEDSNCSGSNTSWKIYRATMPSADRTYYYFDNTNTFTGGGKVPTAYIWSSNYYVKSYGIQYSAWPGTAMTQPDSTITRHENVPIEYVWYITIPSIYDHIIFDKGPGAGSSDPASQTANLTLGTGENQGQPNWFFVVTGEQDNNNNWTGRWAEAIYPVILHGVYFLDSTQITTNIVETGYSFGIEPYRPTGDYDDGYFYFGNGTTGVGYRFYSGATASYYTAATCANNERFVIGTNAVDGLTFSEGSYHLYVKYTSSSEDYKTVYIDARASGNRNDPNSYWTGIHVTVWTDASTRIDLFEAGSSSVYYLTDFFYKVTLHEGLVFAIDNGITPFSGSHSTVKNITVDADTDYLFIYENNAGQNCTIGWFDKIVHNIGTATIYTSTNSGSTWTPQGTMGIGDLTQNFFIFERGVKIAKNTWVKITISGSTNLSLPDGDYVYANLTSGDNGKTAAYLTSESGNIKINVDNGRFTFYLTASSEIAIAKVPYKGNGFYIMPTTTSGNTDGYDNYIKMLTKSEDKGTYEGFNIVIENETPLYYYVRSYMNAHDVLYTSISLTPGIVSDVILEKDGESKNTGIIKFTKSGTYTFVVKGSTLTISEFAINDFFKLNGLDKNAIDSQNAIKDQKTSLVLEVKLAANNNAAIKLKVTPRTNTLTPYVGFSVFATTKSYDDLHTEDSTTYAENDVYHYMRENCYSLGTFAQTATTVIPAKTSGSVYLYILVDYLYSASLSDMPYNISGLLNFTVSIVQQ